MKTFRIIILSSLLFCNCFANAQKEKNIYYPILPQVKISIAKINLAQILKTTKVWKSDLKDESYNNFPIRVSISDHRIQMNYENSEITIYFSELIKLKISANYCEGRPPFPCLLYIGDYNFYSNDGNQIKELTDYFFYFQQHFDTQFVQRHNDSLITIFKPIADEYCTLKVKPAVSEEQRKYIVQANLLNNQKMYSKSIELYQKAIEVDETAYPAAYSNLALISAQINDLQAAIFYMRKYLMLVPEAEDARSCQDKIYEWEIMMQN